MLQVNRLAQIVAALTVLVALCARAGADNTGAPWAAGVSEANKTEANRLLEKGNALFLASKFADALALYREAVEAWDHPAIRFNIVRCLIQLDRTVEAAENLESTLRFGAAPLEDAVYTEALAYQRLLAKQIGDVTIECAQANVLVSLDGTRVATCPARETRRLSPGRHQVLGTGGGLLPRAMEIVVIGGEQQTVKVELEAVPLGGGADVRRFGKVVAYTGGGALAIAGGLGLWAWRRYHAEFPDHCLESPTGGAPLCDPTGADGLDRARLYGNIASVTAGIGAVAVVAGLVVLWRYPAKEHRTVVTPAASGAGLAVSGVF